MSKKIIAVRGVRKAAHLSRRALSKAANLSGRIENKAHGIINGTDSTIQLHDKILFEKVYADALPEIIPLHPALPRAGRKKAVTLMIPSLQKSSFFGGTATALIFAGMLAQKEAMPLRVVEALKHGGAEVSQLVELLTSAGVTITETDIELINVSGRRYDHYGYIDIHPDDIFIASAWWDAHLLDRLPLLKPYIYLIQDYEPIFYNNSDRYILAEQTYHSSKYIAVCNTELMYNFMCGKGYEQVKQSGIWFEPAVAVGPRYGYIAEKAPVKKRRMFIYGRPSVARNLFYFALDCLNDLFTEQQLLASDWELYMAGQDNVADILLASGVSIKNLGKMPLDEYYAFVKTIDVAISPMLAPHPNYPTLEFASSGAAVVTTKYETKQSLGAYSKNIFIAEASKADFTRAIIEAALLSRTDRLQNAKQSNIPTSWQDALTDSVNAVLKKL